jgi:fluoride exporter
MNQLVAIAFGGSLGAVLRFLISNSVYHWLGRDFPYGTLAVNVLGSLLLGLLTEALIQQKIALALDYRSAILVGFIGAFTTFSTFSLETFYLLEQGAYTKATTNILMSVVFCIGAIWLGLFFGRLLFTYSGGVVKWSNISIPYAFLIINCLIAFSIGFISVFLIEKTLPSLEYRAVLLIVAAGVFVTFSSLYLILYLIEDGHAFQSNLHLMLMVFAANIFLCLSALWCGVLAGERI